MLRTLALSFLSLVALALSVYGAHACDNGADVPDDKCGFFKQFIEDGDAVDDRISSRLDPGSSEPAIRSYALVVDINNYPNFALAEDRQLLPAKHDLENLVAFFKVQKFEEIIVLENADASRQNIQYFLEDYLSGSARARDGRARIVFAFSGHGAQGENGRPGALVLSGARNKNDSANTLKLNALAPMLVNLANESYHFLALIGSCYSGGMFPMIDNSLGENYAFPRAKGAHAVSSTTADQLAYGLGGAHGSIFFDSLIEAVMTGRADPIYAGMASFEDGTTLITGGGITRLGPIANFISAKLDLTKNPLTGESFPQLRTGTLRPDGSGAFFFLVPHIRDAPSVPSVNVALNTGSAVEEHPEIKVFNAPDTYKVLGVDISHFSGEVDWNALKNKGLRFAYMKATEGKTFLDPQFKANWQGSQEAGMKRGAYHVVNFCRDAESQFENIRNNVPKENAALPLVIDLEWYKDGPFVKKQRHCMDIDFIRSSLKDLLRMVQNYYGKIPVIYAHEEGIREILADKFPEYPLWLQDWTKDGSPNDQGPTLSGQTPWTIWQFAGEIPYAGVDQVDLNAFFGTEEQFDQFAAGQSNIALQAALAPRVEQ
ncbi:GH25 family lysozyme [Mesorhizobium sp.]|uniref:GH25 family lysozyme n=1 Tax=Mesorhizobium sp. TaxID=1871066 RepID=UPI000FE5FDE8|nr:GH25 family lysozyme [Mesorhizobium sp.]RWA70568.1 MAG: hypothetical protein EOQ29_13390 [Mesorhizobium sp.]RWA83481.1 MAG: hypothetical protein EOQ30_13295 [Mesorhizobium sp.]